MIKSLKSIVVLVCICAVIALALAVTNEITAPIIENNQNAAANAALLEVMPDGKGFDPVSLDGYTLPSTVTEIHKETSGKGYVFKLETTGQFSTFTIMCGVSSDGIVTGAVCLASNATYGHEKTYGENFISKDITAVESVDLISGATNTTSTYKNAIKDAINSVTILNGGNVDIRTEEEIFLDNLNAALPTGEGKFTKQFIVEVINGIDSIYKADNGKGFVCVIGEQFIATDAAGNVLSVASAEISKNVSDAIKAITSTVTTNIDLTQYSVKRNLVSAQKTATGNYILLVKGAGYGIKGDYYISNEYIFVRVSMTKEGKIIDCITVSQAETDGIGSACADEKFYSQFVGKSETDYVSWEALADIKGETAKEKEYVKDIDAIGGATKTCRGYKDAVMLAFESVKILEGGAN